MHFKVSAVLPIDARTFLVERDSAAFRALVAKTQKLGALEIVDGWKDGDVQVFKLVTKPDIDRFVPKRFQSYLPTSSLEYVDIIRYDPKLLQNPPFRLEVHSIPPVFAKRTQIDCVLSIEEVSPSECRQTLEGDVSIKVTGLGKIAEKIICHSLEDVYSGIPEIVERWKVFRDEVLQRPDGREVLFNGRPPLEEDWVSAQVASVLKTPYAAKSRKPVEEVVATAKPGLEKATANGQPAMLPAAASKAVIGEAKTLQESLHQQIPIIQQQDHHLSQQQQQGQAGGGAQPNAAAGQQQRPAGPQAQENGAPEAAEPRQQEGAEARQQAVQRDQPSPFVEAASSPALARTSEDSSSGSQSMAERRRSVAQFEGELFYEPDDIPEGLDIATADSLRQDHREAMDWFRQHSITGGPMPTIAVHDGGDESEPDSEDAGHRRPWWRRTGSKKEAKAAADAGQADAQLPGPQNSRHYTDWVAFWDKTEIAKQEQAPQAATRLGHLFGLGVRLGVVKAGGHKRRSSRGGGSPTALKSEAGSGSSRVRRTKSVGFAIPVVNGVREASPTHYSDEEDASNDKTSCACFTFKPKRRSRY